MGVAGVSAARFDLASRGEVGRAADHDEAQSRRIEEAAGDALRILERHRCDERVAAIEIIDAEPILLQRDQDGGDARRLIELQREGAGEVGLGARELGGGRPFVGKAPPFFADDLDRLRDPAILRRDIARIAPPSTSGTSEVPTP